MRKKELHKKIFNNFFQNLGLVKKLIKINKKNVFFLFLFIFLLFYLSFFIVRPDINKIPFSYVILDQKGEKIGEIIKDNKYRHQKLKYAEIPDFTKKAIIILEDKTFWNNSGIDYIGIIRAIENNISTGNGVQGASTITSQVIKNNYWLNEKRTFFRKINEFYLSLCLTKHYSKEEILTSYLGNIYFGYLNYGIKSAAEYYFGKNLNSLTKAEQIALISLPKNQAKYDPYKNRQNFKERYYLVIDTLEKNNLISNEESSEIKKEKLSFNENHENKLPYIVDFIKSFIIPTKAGISNITKQIEQNKNFKEFIDFRSSQNGQNDIIETTIDYDLTRKIDSISKNSIIPLMWKNVKDYSVIIIDKKTQELRVMIGGINYYAQNGQVNGSLSPRQPGSTIKPFTYVLAFRYLGYNKETIINDLPVQYNTNFGYAYNPKNYSLDYKGQVNIAEALSQSINVPAVKTLEQLGVSKLLNFLKLLGITSLTKNEDYYGLALTLGVGETSLFELTRAYGIFANDGLRCNIKVIKDSKSNCKKIIDIKYTNEIKDILTNRYYKLNSFPINGNLDFPDKEVFLKTGTSRNFKDNWTIGYTSKYLIGVWVGNKDGSEMKGVSGASGAGEIFNAIVNEIENYKKTSNPIILDKKKENYLEIISPLQGSIYKIDTYKPIISQQIKLDLSTNIEYKKAIWKINGIECKNDFLELKKGKNEISIELIDENNNIITSEKSIYFVE